MPFIVDDSIVSSCFELGDWPLSRVFLKNNADYPWLILVPRLNNIEEIDQLSQQSRYLLINEISQLSALARAYFKPDKLNVAALGNIVPQLHIHIIARFTHDKLWPHSIWQSAQTTTAYSENSLTPLLTDLRTRIKQSASIIRQAPNFQSNTRKIPD